MTLYHGSVKIIEKPTYGYGRTDNDYGQGFYCTRDYGMAAEWAASSQDGGFVNEYEIDIKNLKVLNLQDEKYHILNWLAVLLENRMVRLSSSVEKAGNKYLIDNYSINTDEYDIITGYRADDSYFSFARAFLNNTITVEQLSVIMKLGDLGIQYMLKSGKAFDNIKYRNSHTVDGTVYYSKRITRDKNARKDFNKMLESVDMTGHTIRDLMKGGMSDEQLRLL